MWGAIYLFSKHIMHFKVMARLSLCERRREKYGDAVVFIWFHIFKLFKSSQFPVDREVNIQLNLRMNKYILFMVFYASSIFHTANKLEWRAHIHSYKNKVKIKIPSIICKQMYRHRSIALLLIFFIYSLSIQ